MTYAEKDITLLLVRNAVAKQKLNADAYTEANEDSAVRDLGNAALMSWSFLVGAASSPMYNRRSAKEALASPTGLIQVASKNYQMMTHFGARLTHSSTNRLAKLPRHWRSFLKTASWLP